MKTKEEILDEYTSDMKGLLDFGGYSCVGVPYENALKAMESYASQQIEKYKELIEAQEMLLSMIDIYGIYELDEMEAIKIKIKHLKAKLKL